MPAWLQRDWCSSFVLALGHFVWQGTLIAVVLAIALRATKAVSVRYWLSLAALLVMAVSPVVTLGWLLRPLSHVVTLDLQPIVREEPAPSPPIIPAAPFEEASDVGHVSNVPVIPLAPPLDFNTTGTNPLPVPADERSWWRKFAPQLTMAYLCGVALMLLRLVFGLWGGRRLRRRVHLIDDPSLLNAMRRQATALGLKLLPVLAYCERVTVPTVVGVLKPMILLPLTLTSGLSPEQMESVLAHELAHLRRYDHLVNLLQRVIESLLFFHPALWWVSHRIRDEREHCCDDLVVACGAMPLDYAKSLLVVAELSRTSPLRRSVAAVSLLATGNQKPSNLRQRIARLLGESATPSLRVSPRALLLAICIPLIAVIATIQSGASNQQPSRSDKDEPSQTTEFSTKLRNGVTVKLVGVGFHPSEKREWWRADGSPLDKRPYEKFVGNPLYQDESRLADCREFALEIRGLPQDHFVMTRIDGGPKVGSVVLNELKEDVFFTKLKAGQFADEKTTSLVVGLSVDPLGPAQRIGPDGRKLAAVAMPPDAKLLDDLIQPLRVQSRDGGTVLVLKPLAPFLLHQKAEWRLVAIDSDGQETTSNSQNESAQELEIGFKLPLARLARFEYRLRPLRHWVTFENVSLVPGRQTDVKVKMESPPADPARLQVKNPRGSKALFNDVVKATVGFPETSPDVWVRSPDREGIVSLDGLPVGTHWLLAAGNSPERLAFPVTIPTEQPLLERRLRDPAWLGKKVELAVQPVVEVDEKAGEVIVIEILNQSHEALNFSEADIVLLCELPSEKVRGREWLRGLSPKWLIADQEPFPRTKIEAGQTGRMRLNWREWVRQGLWSSRNHEPIGEPGFPPNEPGKIWVKAGLGNGGSLPVSVTEPKSLILAAVDERTSDPRPAQEKQSDVFGVQVSPRDKASPFVLQTQRIPGSIPAKQRCDLTGGVVVELKMTASRKLKVSADRAVVVVADEPRSAMLEVLRNEHSISAGDNLLTVTGVRGGWLIDRPQLLYSPNGKLDTNVRAIEAELVGFDHERQEVRILFRQATIESPTQPKSFAEEIERRFPFRNRAVWEFIGNVQVDDVRLPNEPPARMTAKRIIVDCAKNMLRAERVSVTSGESALRAESLELDLTGKEAAKFDALPIKQDDARKADEPDDPAENGATNNPATGSGDPRPAQNSSVTDETAKELQRVDQAPSLSKVEELELFASRLRSIVPRDWVVERKDRAFRLRGPDVSAGKERAQILLWFDDVWVGSSDALAKRDKSLPKISHMNNTRIGRHYFTRNTAAEELWPEFGLKVRLIEPVDQIAIATADVLQSEVVSRNWFDAAFVRYIEIGPDGRRQSQLVNLDGSAIGITAGTKCLVVGKLPNPQTATNEADRGSAFRHLKTFDELRAEAKRHGVRTISLEDFERYTESAVKEGRGFRTHRIDDANKLQIPECLTTGQGLVVVRPSESQTKVDSAPPDGLDFLKPYPKLHGLSLDMTEPQFLEIVTKQELKTRKTVEGEKVTHHIALGDGHTLIVMFDKDAKCSGIQRVRGEDTLGELEPFQGTWAMDLCDSETKGFGDSQEVVKNWRWAINGNEIVWSRSKDEVWKLTFAVDPTKSPKEIDLTFLDGPHKGEKCLGMYEWGGVNKKMLLMSVQDPGAKVERPKSISMKGGGQTSLIFLEPMNAEKELASLQGTWKFEIIQTDGWPKPIGKGPDRLGRGDDRQWVIKGNEITWTSPDGEEVKLSFTIDPTKSPKHFDVTFLSGPHKGQKCLGMYERGGLGGVVLWLCLTDPGSQASRPTKVSYGFEEGRTMIGLIRVERSEKPVDKAQNGVQSLRKPALLLPDHWIVQAVGFDNDGKELVTASNQSFITIRRWDVVGRKLISEIKLQADKHGRAVRSGTLKFSGDRRRVVAATDEYVGIWDATTGRLLKQLPFKTKEGIYDCAINLLDCTPDLSVIVGHRALPGRMTLVFDAHVIAWDGVSGNVLQTVIAKGATNLKAIDLSTDGKRLVTTNGSGAKIWETRTGQLLRSIPNDNTGRKHSDPEVTGNYNDHVWSVQLSPDAKQLAVGDILGVRLWDVASGKLLQQLEGPYRYSSIGGPDFVFSKDGQWLARLGTQEKVFVNGDKHRYVVPIWSTRTGARLFELHTEANDAAFSDDGQRLAVVFSDMQQALSVWPLSGDAANVEQTAGPGPHSRQDRVEENGHYVGKTAAEFIEQFKPTWGDTKQGLQYGIALTKPQRQFRGRDGVPTYERGERVPLVAFFRNASDKPIKFDTAPDFFGNTPKVLNARGEPIALENIPLLGHIPHYHEKLAPGEALGPFYLNFGLGENPRPGQQNWHPYFKTPVTGQYKLTHSVSINVTGQKDGDPSKRDDIATGTIEFEIVAGGQPATDDQANHPPTATRANQTISLADAVRDFNAENKQLGRGLDQPALTEDEVIAVIKRDRWKPEIVRPKTQKHLTWAWKVIKRDQWKSEIAPLNEKEIAAFKAVAESKRLPKDSYLQVDIEERPETFLFRQSWQVRLMLPAIGHDGFVGLTIRDTKLTEEKIDPQHVAWGKPDADGLSLGAYLSPKKDQYALGERVRLRLFVRNDGQKPVTTTWANTTHPMPEDFAVSDETGAKVAIRIGHESWNLPWISGYVSGGLAPGNVHAFFVPYEISLGGNGSKNKLIGRVIDARPGQTLQLKVRSHNGNDRKRANGELEPESGNVTFTVADDAKVSAAVDEKVGSGLTPGHFGGANQVMRIGPDGSISYGAGQGLCQMTLFEDDRLQIAFHNELQIWTDVTLPLVASPGPQRRAAWSAEIDGHTYHATAIPFSSKGCVFRLEKRLNGKLIHGTQQFFAVETKASKNKLIAERDAPAVAPINLREWRVDQSGTGVVAGQYTGAKQIMQIAADGTVSYSDHPQGICHLAVLEDDRLTATFLDKSGNPQDVMLPLVSNANGRAKWSAEVDSHTLRATASPYSDNVYIFRLEKLLNGKLIEGSQEFYAIQQKLRKATPEELEAVSKL